jgi:CBS domain containing-hemolysin-like protein
MPEGEFETLAGFLLDRLGHIPKEGERLTIDGWTFEVAKMDRHRIAAVRVVAPQPEEAVPSGAGSP